MFIPTQHASGEVIWLKKIMVVQGFVMLSKSKISFRGSYFERLALSVMAVKWLPETFLGIVDTGMCGVRRLPYYVAQYNTYQGKGTGVPVLN